MEYVYLGIAIFAVLAVLGLLAYLIVNHKISSAALTATLTGLKDQLHLVHASVQTQALAAASAAASPAVAVAPVKAVVDAPPPAAAAPAPAPAPASEPSNPFVAFKAQGLDLWECEGIKYLNRAVTAADLPLIKAAGYVLPQGILDQIAGNPTLGPAAPSYDPGKTALDSSDFGHIFFPPAGTTTTYAITGPARISLVIDGEQTLGEFARGQIDSGPEYTVGFGVPDTVAGGVLGPVGPGLHTFKVTNNAVVGKVGVQITQA